MKLLMIFCIIITSCQMDPIYYNPEYVKNQDVPINFDNPDEAWKYVSSLKYISDGFDEEWQTPLETFNRGGGDCEDFVILLGFFLDRMNLKSYLVAIHCPETNSRHAIMKFNGKYIDPQVYDYFYDKNTIDIMYEKIYNDVYQESWVKSIYKENQNDGC